MAPWATWGIAGSGDHHGAVVDYVTLSHWPTFNVADACITVGVVVLAISVVVGPRRGPGRPNDAGEARGPADVVGGRPRCPPDRWWPARTALVEAVAVTGSFDAIVPASLDGVRVDRAVSMLTGISRAAATELVAGGGVSVGGKPVTTRGTPLRAGQRLEVDLPDAGATGLVPEPSVPVAVVFTGPALVVVDKAPGQVVHPGAGQEHGTLVAGLVARFPDIGLAGRRPL